MNWKYDPSLTSADYLAIARKRLAYKANRFEPYGSRLDWSDRLEFWLQDRVFQHLLTADVASELAVSENRKPRIFLDARINVRGNLEVTWWGGTRGVECTEDFNLRVALHPPAYYGDQPPAQVIWVEGYRTLVDRVLHHHNPVAKALVFGVKALIAEVADALSTKFDVIGRADLVIGYTWKRVNAIDIVSIGDEAKIKAIVDEEQRAYSAYAKQELKKFPGFNS
ncbi:hypothetical protein RB623_29305 [Mesorhizobium sp. LHD-90]|uniref:hypothetical protein n=1 Tax=Mesorhizobium sp. LHD-90 TaxID=3071414 RepID=UPI0027E1BD63|nr:hypothetical protein [Mesorhizobium sp. LHD-90]MDQ6438171.1 hypothetical protein [Mesorhizobium sp. LHD-90]